MRRVVLGLDIATKTGWCLENGHVTCTGVMDCSPESKDEPEGVRYRRLAEALPALLTGVTTCVLEQPFSRGMRTAQVLNGLTAIALVALEMSEIDYAFVPAPALKSFGREYGAVGKEAMRALASKLLGRDLTDDEADAFWLVRYWQERMAPDEEQAA